MKKCAGVIFELFGKNSSFKNPEKLFSKLKNSSVGSFMCPVHFEIKSNRQVIVEGCQSIGQYDENMVKIKVKKMAVSFFGKDLNIKCLDSDSLIIDGFITSIEFDT